MAESEDEGFPFELTQFGFDWGPAKVIRYTQFPDHVVLGVETIAGKKISIYVSKHGRSVRVFSKGREWKPS